MTRPPLSLPPSDPSRQRWSLLSLRTILTVPFLLQLIATVGLVGYLSFRNGQKAVNDLALQLQAEVSDRVHQHLDAYFTAPRQLNKINQTALQLNLLQPEDVNRTSTYFWQQMSMFPQVSYISYAEPDGEFIGVGRQAADQIYLELRQPNTDTYVTYKLDSKGQRTQQLTTGADSTLQKQRYSTIASATKPIWSNLYPSGDQPGDFSISCGIPLFDAAQNLIGVIGIDLFLPQMNQFLQSLHVSSTGQAFIIQRDGTVLATSSNDKPYLMVGGFAQPLNVLRSDNVVMRTTAEQIQAKFGDFGLVRGVQQFEIPIEGKRYFVRATSWQDPWGLDLLLLVAIPESDFIGQINANTRTTVLLCLASLLGAIALGILTSRWISRPIQTLSQAAQRMSNGSLDQQINVRGASEIETLAHSFNRMSEQLNTSFAELETQNAALNHTSRALTEAKEQLEAVLNAVPGPISWINSGGVYIGVNHHFAKYWNLSQEAFIGKEVGFLQGNAELADFIRQFLHSNNHSASQEIALRINDTVRYYLIAAQKYQNGSAAVSVGIDITQRKQAEEALRIAEEKYRSIFENALEGIFQSTPEGRFISVNPAMARIYGYDSPEEMIQSITDIRAQIYVNADDRTELQQVLARQNQISNSEYQVYRKDGSIIWVEEDTRSVRERSGRLLYYEGTVRDITERKRREEELKRQLEVLKVEIDHQKREHEVAAILQSNYFQDVQEELNQVDLDEFWS